MIANSKAVATSEMRLQRVHSRRTATQAWVKVSRHASLTCVHKHASGEVHSGPHSQVQTQREAESAACKLQMAALKPYKAACAEQKDATGLCRSGRGGAGESKTLLSIGPHRRAMWQAAEYRRTTEGHATGANPPPTARTGSYWQNEHERNIAIKTVFIWSACIALAAAQCAHARLIDAIVADTDRPSNNGPRSRTSLWTGKVTFEGVAGPGPVAMICAMSYALSEKDTRRSTEIVPGGR